MTQSVVFSIGGNGNILSVLMDNFLEALDKIPLNEQGQISKDGR